jgi:hypothetical protein
MSLDPATVERLVYYHDNWSKVTIKRLQLKEKDEEEAEGEEEEEEEEGDDDIQDTEI